ncbi:MAG: homogentisate 1,2-dioxygenase [Bdellovibrionales bacterium]|nr:homogentisate 1,2-dioxygenase [Bdellovibrionales bacterium]
MKKRQPHRDIPLGNFEEEQGQQGFYGRVSHLIKEKPSTRWTHIEGNLKPRLFNLAKFKKEGWIPLLYNDNVSLFLYQLEKADTACRMVDGDVLYFCHKGSGVILTEYGLLNYSEGHYFMIPKCFTHFMIPHSKSSFFVIKSLKSHFREPDRGMLGRHALYSSNSLIKPDLKALQNYLKKHKLEVKKVMHYHQGESTCFTYKDCIFDVLEWQGDLFPFSLSMEDIMPIMSHRVHLPPSVHTTFLTQEFIVCSFLPRPLEEDKSTLKVPFYHQNTDYDEVIFYHKGDFFSRDNIDKGMMTLHPAGFPHGPHPKAFQASSHKTHTNEYAVMIDSQSPFKRTKEISSLEIPDYWKSWK